MNDVQRFILNRAMQKVASKGMQKEANPFVKAYDKATDWLANAVYHLSPQGREQSYRAQELKPSEPVKIGQIRTEPTDRGKTIRFTLPLYEQMYDKHVRSLKEKSQEYLARYNNPKSIDYLSPSVKRKGYDLLYEAQRRARLLDDNLNTPYVDFIKQYPDALTDMN